MLTGVSGFIGSRVCQLLLEQGHEVIGVDSMNDYYDIRIKEYRLNLLNECDHASSFHFHELDIESQCGLKNLFSNYKGFDAILNLAARAGVRYSIENPHVYLSTNAEGTLNLLECMRIHGCTKMVLASTSSLYAGQEMPFTEDLHITKPLSPYAASKKSAELLAYVYHNLYGFDISVLRYFTVFGPAGRPDMSPFRFIKWIAEEESIQMFGDGSQARDFSFVDDIARGTVLALKRVGYEIINLGGGCNPISLNSMIKSLESLLVKKAKVECNPSHAADMNETWADISKAKELLGWKPEFSFDEGLKKTVEWYLLNREWLKEIKI